MDNANDHPLLLRYIADECTPGERAELEAWMAAEPGRAEYVASLHELQRTLGSAGAVPDSQAAWARMRRRIGGTSRLRRSDTHRSGWRVMAPYIVGAAAACLVAGVVLSLRAGGRGRLFATAAGQRSTITLSDGTQLTLGPASSVRLAADYGRDRRDVTLNGEAYFVVAHDVARPFAVHARNALARDVGTRFVVRAYVDDQDVSVTVTEGAVSLGTGGRDAAHASLISSGIEGVVSHAGVVTVGAVDTSAAVAWTQGRLVLHAIPLGAAAAEIGRWYDLDVRVADPALARLPVTITATTDPPDQVLALLASVVGARIERKGRLVVVLPR